MLPLILASSSPARKALLQRLQLPFTCFSPNIDETPLPAETGHDLALRLAKAKAQIMTEQSALVIGSDTVVVLGNQHLDKPQTFTRAYDQLQQSSGRTITCYTGLCLLNQQTRQLQASVETYQVTFKILSAATIQRYLERDQPLQCAGSIKAESLGIALFSQMTGQDFTTLIGLPLMRLVDMLAHENVTVI